MLSSIRCIQVIAGVLGRAGETGTKQRLEAADKGETTYEPAKGLHWPQEEEGSKVSSPIVTELLEEEGLGNSEELAAKLEEAGDHDGRRHGHRIKAST